MPQPTPVSALGSRRRTQAPCPGRLVAWFRCDCLAQAPDRAREVELARLRLRHHAVEISARRGSEMLGGFGRDDGDRDCCLFPAYGLASLAPKRFRDPELTAQ